ncbi:uncharacterized protein CANTADRAFT_20587 [Suhomyces tanzawaensis NRRL Y-17324]|uniref:Uncharacterized protein n=1 Tax=Suhomyces tanzawaensis NRRL Y-17324 TaxID=984487 RepID=A0A1E4SNE4_9ASCO|nr:uncharacterized protein CANTADRAFT_20587 [Suhomyces tanzawaensis NRRL Y-17324]ODV81041.1 hypothetical protein CANTADRAFT_20587 [Suhomyces tanzawaensis NRRL Y-17324]
MAVHNHPLEPIAIPSAVPVLPALPPSSRSPKHPRRAKRTLYTSISQQSLQRLQQYYPHPLSDEYVPAGLYECEVHDGITSHPDPFYSDDDSDELFSSCSSVSSSSVAKSASSYDFRAPGSVSSVSTANTSVSTISPPHVLCISPPHTSIHITPVTAHEFHPTSPPVLTSPSSDALAHLLRERLKKTFVSNLSSSFKTWKHSFSTNWLPYSLSPRMTDDLIPPSPTPDSEAQELITFKAKPCVPQDLLYTRKSFKSRDQRINSAFLRLYAADFHARTVTRTLPNTSYDASNQDHTELASMVESNPLLKNFHYHHNIYRVSSMSRDKLWNSIILPPRADDSPQHCIDYSTYIYIGDDSSHNVSSVIRPSGKNYMPWCSRSGNNTSTFTPAGTKRNGPVMLNGLAPSSGVTKTQFTVKGWCNPRWTLNQHIPTSYRS